MYKNSSPPPFRCGYSTIQTNFSLDVIRVATINPNLVPSFLRELVSHLAAQTTNVLFSSKNVQQTFNLKIKIVLQNCKNS